MSRGREEERKTRQDKRWCRTKGWWQSWRNVSWSVRQNGELHWPERLFASSMCSTKRSSGCAIDFGEIWAWRGPSWTRWQCWCFPAQPRHRWGGSGCYKARFEANHMSGDLGWKKNKIMVVYNSSEILENGPYQMNKNIDINTNTNSNTFTKKIDVIVKGKGSQ